MSESKYDPLPGTDISDACRDALVIATRTGSPVGFRFNGVQVQAQPGQLIDEVIAGYLQECERRAEAYRNSPEGKRAAAEAEADRQRFQERTDALMRQLPEAVQSLDSLVRWCVAMSQSADRAGVTWDHAMAARTIVDAGYPANLHIRLPKSAFKKSTKLVGEWLVGQAVACMLKGMPPHPITEMFARDAGFLDGGSPCST